VKGKIHHVWIEIITSKTNQPVSVPLIIAKGEKDGKKRIKVLILSLGPVLGLSTTIHGDEAKGITIFQKIFKMIDLTRLSGTLMTV
jgi:uncharacterized protein